MEQTIAKLVDGFTAGKVNRRQLIQTLTAITAPAVAASGPGAVPATAAENSVIMATNVNHIAYGASDYGRTRDFYSQLFNMKVADDNGRVARLAAGDNLLVINHGDQAGKIQHIGYTLANWDTKKEEIKAEIERQGIKIVRGDTRTSLYINDPDGFLVQLGGLKQ